MSTPSEFTSPDGLIDSSVFPITSRQLDTGWLDEQETFSRQTGSTIGRTSADLHDTWHAKLPENYSAPEAEKLSRAMRPVADRGEHEQETWHAAAGHISTFTLVIGPLTTQLKRIAFDADDLRNQVASGVWVTASDVEHGLVDLGPAELASWYDGAKTGDYVLWHKHRPTVERNETLLADVRQVTTKIRDAHETLRRGLRSLNDGGVVSGGQVGRTARGRLPGNFAGAGLDPGDIAWFAPGKDFLDNADPGEVRTWWDELSPWQRRALIAGMPLVIGNLNGIPLGMRARANDINIRNEIQRLENEIAQLDAGITAADSPVPGQSSGGLLARVDRLESERAELAKKLASYKGYLDLADAPGDVKKRERFEYDENGIPSIRTGVNLVAFNPTTSTIATYYGPFDESGDIPDWVQNIAVHSPGTKTRMDDFQRTDEDVYNFYNGANQYDIRQEAGATAWIAWAGGEYPATIPAATQSSYEDDLGPKMHSFVGGVNPPNGSTLTVTGHSYGGTIVASAELDGLKADRILYISGAGLGNGVEAVEDFPNTGDTPHYTMMARNDAVVGLIQKTPLHGASALYDPDVLRLESGFQDAGKLNSGTIESTGFLDSHSAIYDDGSTGYSNIIGVVTGTQVEAFAEDRVAGSPQSERVVMLDGIRHPDYEPHIIDVTEWERAQR